MFYLFNDSSVIRGSGLSASGKAAGSGPRSKRRRRETPATPTTTSKKSLGSDIYTSSEDDDAVEARFMVESTKRYNASLALVREQQVFFILFVLLISTCFYKG